MYAAQHSAPDFILILDTPRIRDNMLIVMVVAEPRDCWQMCQVSIERSLEIDGRRACQQRVEVEWNHRSSTQAGAEGRRHGLAAPTDQTKPDSHKKSGSIERGYILVKQARRCWA